MNQPILTEEEEEYYTAFLELLNARPYLVFPLGMTGSLMLRQISTPEDIEKAGAKLGFEGDELEDFVAIISRIEREDFEATFREQVDRALRASKKPPG